MFKFRLQRILELRELAEQAKARTLASAQDAAEVARREHETLAEMHASSRAEVDSAQRAEPRVGHLRQLGLVLQALDERVLAAGETVRAADDDVADARKLLDVAARDRRVLDRLKGRHTDQWKVDEAHKDRLQMDEIALGRFSRTAEMRASDDAATRSSPSDVNAYTSKNDGPTS